MIRSRAEYGCRQFRLEFHTRSGEPGNALDLTYRLLIHFQPSNPELRQVITLRPQWQRTMSGGFQEIEVADPVGFHRERLVLPLDVFLIRFSSAQACANLDLHRGFEGDSLRLHLTKNQKGVLHGPESRARI